MSGWPSGLRRQTQGYCLTSEYGVHMKENSGPQLRAWVQIPFLTTDFTPFCMYLVD